MIRLVDPLTSLPRIRSSHEHSSVLRTTQDTWPSITRNIVKRQCISMANRDLTFGPEGEQWHYDRSRKTYDLTRGRTPTYKFGTTQGPGETYITISPELSALVVVDMQNFFLHPDCRAHPPGLAAVEPTLNAIAKARELGMQVCPQPTPQYLSSRNPIII